MAGRGRGGGNRAGGRVKKSPATKAAEKAADKAAAILLEITGPAAASKLVAADRGGKVLWRGRQRASKHGREGRVRGGEDARAARSATRSCVASRRWR